jgi:predicted nucleic acid-binding protein
MSQFYFDTSAIVKYYHDEPGSHWVRQIINAREPDELPRANQIQLAEITIAETAAAFAVLERTKQIRKTARDAMYREFLRDVANEYVTIHIRREEIDRAAELTQQHNLKGYDAIQLAVALYVNDLLKANDLLLTFVASDNTLLQAARAEGIAIENPFDHRDLDTTS